MSDEDYVRALVNGHATIEYRSERVLVDEVKRLRAEKDEAWASRARAINEYVAWLSERDAKVAKLEAEISDLQDDVLEHKDACGHLRAALVGRGLDIDAMRAENAELRKLIAEGDFKDIYAEGIEMGKRFTKPEVGT
jgi:hypothetical protein